MFSVRSSLVREKKFASTRLGKALMQRKGDTVTDNNALYFAHRMREREELRKKRKLSKSSDLAKIQRDPRDR